MYVIAADGSADFTSMAEAAQSLPDGALVVYREGDHEENASFPQNNLRLVGEHRDRTKVRGRVVFTGENAVAESMTFLGETSGAQYRDCVINRQTINNAPPAAPCLYLLGDADVPVPVCANVRDCRMPGYSVKRFITEKRLDYAELCYLPGDRAIYCLSAADESTDIIDRADPLRVYPYYLAMIANEAREFDVQLTFVLETSRVGAHAAAARAFCKARSISIEEI